MAEKEQTPFETIKKRLPRIDFDSLTEVNHSVKELLTDERYCNFLTRRPFWDLYCEYVTSVAVTSVFRPASSREYLNVVVSRRSEESYDNQTLEDISIPIIYLTDEEALKLAAIKQKEAERMPRAEVDKIRETDEYKEYCRLNEKYKWLDQIKFS